MKRGEVTDSVWFVIVCMLLTGVGIGWLIGLSVSPVVSIVLTSLTGSLAAIVAALSSIQPNIPPSDGESRPTRWLGANPLPLAMLVCGIMIGSVFGLLARNNQLLGSDLSAEIAKWSSSGVPREQIVARLLAVNYPNGGLSALAMQTLEEEIQHWVVLGIAKEEVVRRLFERHYPEGGMVSLPRAESDQRYGSILFGVSAEECDILRSEALLAKDIGDTQGLIAALRRSTDAGLQQLPDVVSDVVVLQEIVEDVLCKNGSPP